MSVGYNWIGNDYIAWEDDSEDDDDRKETDPSRTNMMVRRIIKSFDKFTYVGYTATPFANVLIDPEEGKDDPVHGLSLYPRHFIKSLKISKLLKPRKL